MKSISFSFQDTQATNDRLKALAINNLYKSRWW